MEDDKPVSRWISTLRQGWNANQRVFAYRKRQPWPPKVVIGDGWDIQYQAQKYNLPILPSVDEAVAWVNDLIQRIDDAEA
jgi:hypothetical protein